MSSGSFKNIINKMCLQIIFNIYIYKQDLALNNLQWLICHKNQTSYPNLYIRIKFFFFVFVVGPKREKSKYLKINRCTKRLIFFKLSICSFLRVFLSSWYLQRMFDNFGWFSIYILVIVLMAVSVQVLLLSCSFSIFPSFFFQEFVLYFLMFFFWLFFFFLN